MDVDDVARLLREMYRDEDELSARRQMRRFRESLRRLREDPAEQGRIDQMCRDLGLGEEAGGL